MATASPSASSTFGTTPSCLEAKSPRSSTEPDRGRDVVDRRAVEPRSAGGTKTHRLLALEARSATPCQPGTYSAVVAGSNPASISSSACWSGPTKGSACGAAASMSRNFDVCPIAGGRWVLRMIAGVSKERMHLDLETDDIEAEYSCARLVMKRSPAGQVRPAPNRHESQGLTTLRPHLAAVAGQWVEHTDAGVWIWARSQAPQATCPSCGHALTRAHGRYSTPAGGCVDWRAQGRRLAAAPLLGPARGCSRRRDALS